MRGVGLGRRGRLERTRLPGGPARPGPDRLAGVRGRLRRRAAAAGARGRGRLAERLPRRARHDRPHRLRRASTDIGKPQEGETVVVSAAAGRRRLGGRPAREGAGRARRRHRRAAPEKCALLTDELGFDAAVDYKARRLARPARRRPRPTASTWTSRTSAARSWTRSSRASTSARRVALCGLISGYNEDEPPPGPRSFGNLLVNRVLAPGLHRARPLPPRARGGRRDRRR